MSNYTRSVKYFRQKVFADEQTDLYKVVSSVKGGILYWDSVRVFANKGRWTIDRTVKRSAPSFSVEFFEQTDEEAFRAAYKKALKKLIP